MNVSRTPFHAAPALLAAIVLSSTPSCGSDSAANAVTTDGGSDSAGEAAAANLFADNDAGTDVPPACAPGPANFDFPGNNCDDDGDGTLDNPPSPCDANLDLTGDAAAFARALGICQSASDTRWGLVSAVYTNTHATPAADLVNDAQHGIMAKFGDKVVPREGASLGVLSSGFARAFDDATGTSALFKGKKTPMQASAAPPGGLPEGFPRSAAGCPSQANSSAHDLIDVKLVIKVPRNAKGIQYDFNFWSSEWPEFVCSDFNDAFIAFLTSKSGGGNISFDAQNNPVSVNNGFFDRCTPNTLTGCLGDMMKTAACPGGTDELSGTGFAPIGQYCPTGGQTSAGGATGWLSSKAPVTSGETITLEFIIWDVGDSNFDSSVLLDHFQWIQGNTTTETNRPPPN